MNYFVLKVTNGYEEETYAVICTHGDGVAEIVKPYHPTFMEARKEAQKLNDRSALAGQKVEDDAH